LGVRFGALLTVLAIANDPFAQQLVQYRNSFTFEADMLGQSKITLAQRYSKGTFIGQGPTAITCKCTKSAHP
jgi:hypothetical protein